MSDETFVPDFDLGVFRYTAAGYVKYLIRTRWKVNPGFLTASELGRWELSDIANDTVPAWKLSAMAADALATLNHDHIPLCGSGGIRETDESTPIGRLIQNVSALIVPDGGGPYHHGTLIYLTSLLKQSKPVNWRDLVAWDLLGQIRDDLDQLPHPVKPRAKEGRRRDETEAAPEPDNAFRRCAGDWTFRYRGLRYFALKNTSGTTYIHHLLQHQGADIDAHELAAVWDSSHRASHPRSDALAEGLQISRTRDDGPLLDQRSLSECKSKYEEISENLKEAERNNDSARISALKAEKHELAEIVFRAVRPGGRPVVMGDRLKKVVEKVTKAIRRTISKIRENDTGLGSHFDAFITTGVVCSYAPELPITWDT